MPPHSTGSATITFGLVSIPSRIYTATSSGRLSFNMLHAKCGSRIKQQQICPTCNIVVDRSQLVRGYEFAKDQYVRFTEEELKSFEEENSRLIEIQEFVPLSQVDPIYFENTYYLGPDKGGEKAYRLLSDAMDKSGRVALAKHVMRGKTNLVIVRPAQHGLMLHTMYFADEVRNFGDIDKGDAAKLKAGELELAQRLIEELSAETFSPEKYHDEYRDKLMGVVDAKIEGKEITAAEPQAERAQVIDLMEALKQSIAETGSKKESAKPADRKPAAKARSAPAGGAKRKVAGRK